MNHRKGLRVASLACAASLALTTVGCTATSSSISDPAKGNSSSDPGCIAALKAVSTYGPHAVEALAAGRETVNRVEVHLLVIALDAAADAANQPADKQAISSLANVYEQFYVLKTTVVAVPVATLLKDTTDLDSVCNG